MITVCKVLPNNTVLCKEEAAHWVKPSVSHVRSAIFAIRGAATPALAESHAVGAQRGVVRCGATFCPLVRA